MIKIENIKVYNIDQAIEGMRYAKKSGDKSDSLGMRVIPNDELIPDRFQFSYQCDEYGIYYHVGANDEKLAQQLISSGSPHDKFMRQILVSMDITAPLYWWKEMDTYKVATVADSESSMHTMHKEGITSDLYSFDNGYVMNNEEQKIEMRYLMLMEAMRQRAEGGDTEAWRWMIQHNPDGFNQKRKWTANYVTLRGMNFTGRKTHKQIEWRADRGGFTSIFPTMPYGKEFICYEKVGN
jgi:hypothetical protein